MKERKPKAREHQIPLTARRWVGYAVAVGGTVVAVLVRWAFERAFGGMPIYFTFYPAVFAAAVVGGTGPGVLATLLSALIARLLFIEQVGNLELGTTPQAVRLGFFIITNLAISVLGGRLRKHSEALRESEARLRMAHQAAHIGAFEWNLQTGLNLWTPELEAMYGLKPGTFGRTEAAWEQLVHPEDRAKAVKTVERALKTFQPEEGEWRVVWPDGSVHWLVGRFQAFKDPAGKPLRLVGVNLNITERKRLQEHLEEAVEERTAKLHEAMAELEHMSYSMVHDMRAPLRAMQSFAGMMQEECAECRRPPGLDYLHRIRESSNRLDRLITDALSYNQVVREDLSVTPVEIGKLLRGMIQTYPNLRPPAAEITLEFEELFVLGNESLLTQCFGSLLDNAAKFVAPGVRPRIRVWTEEMRSAECRVQSGESGNEPPTSSLQTPGCSIRLWIQDNGIGIPKEAQEKIFLMFQRMHRENEYPGTGIGLAIVRKAVERMNGHVGVESEPGKGSKFWIELPKPTEAQERLREAA